MNWNVWSGADAAKWAKKEVLGGYVRFLHSIDPKVATHVLTAQKEVFLAGKAFFEEEIRHADKALDKIASKTNPPNEPPSP